MDACTYEEEFMAIQVMKAKKRRHRPYVETPEINTVYNDNCLYYIVSKNKMVS
jgi:hypothetical protein